MSESMVERVVKPIQRFEYHVSNPLEGPRSMAFVMTEFAQHGWRLHTAAPNPLKADRWTLIFERPLQDKTTEVGR